MANLTMIDYGGSNIRSALKAFEYLRADIELTGDPEVVRRARKLVLPGVGAFGSGMTAVRSLGLDAAIHEAVEAGVLLLGICVGMQFLFDESDELGIHTGLGLIPGQVTRFRPATAGLKVPHMGWNQIDHHDDHWLLSGVPKGGYAYFVHSYHCRPVNQADIVATTIYDGPFASVVARGQVCGIQFHPEKSQDLGLRILRNYMEQKP